MSKPYYAIQLEDYTLPSYLPFPKTYYGTLEQIDALIRCLDADPATAIRFASTICAFEHFQKGQLDAMHTISNQTVRLLTPVQLIHETMIVEDNAQWYFNNGVYQHLVGVSLLALFKQIVLLWSFECVNLQYVTAKAFYP